MTVQLPLVHAYFTDGFFAMAEVFLQSLRLVHGDSKAPLVYFDTRGLKPDQVDMLKDQYVPDRLHVNALKLPIREWAKKAEVPMKQLLQWKMECESRYVSQNNRVWKLMTAGDDRVRRLHELLWYYDEVTEAYSNYPPFIAHFDIDTLFRKPLESVEALMEKKDIWLKLRPGNKVVKARITIDCILVRPTREVLQFFGSWLNEIKMRKPRDRPVGYGQSSCWYAFQRFPELSCGSLPLEWGLPGRNNPDDIIWTGNVHKLAKDDCVELFGKEMESWRTS